MRHMLRVWLHVSGPRMFEVIFYTVWVPILLWMGVYFALYLSR